MAAEDQTADPRGIEPLPPALLPVFPLTGTLLLPGNYLPLNVFEPRYRRLVEDVMQGGRHFGMVQPILPGPDNRGPVAGVPEHPDLYAVGCAGRIAECERQADGRYLVVLQGVMRFRALEEVDGDRPYRRVRADYSEFLADLAEPRSQHEGARLLAAVELFIERHELELDRELLRCLPGISLLNALCAALPFAPAERQALLEAPVPGRREELLLDLMGMGFADLPTVAGEAPPTVN